MIILRDVGRVVDLILDQKKHSSTPGRRSEAIEGGFDWIKHATVLRTLPTTFWMAGRFDKKKPKPFNCVGRLVHARTSR